MEEDQLRFWVGFNSVKGIGPVRFRKLIEYFGSASDAWNASMSQLRVAGLPEAMVVSLMEFRGKHNLAEDLQKIQNKNIQIITTEDDAYPRLLKEIDNPPPLFYALGNLPPQETRCIAVVGTRRMTAYGRKIAHELSRYLAENGVAIVSGLARGIDSIAHQAALSADGITVAVLGSGLDVIYPPEHRQLSADIVLHRGALISEYAPEANPDRGNFPSRNRIISGLSSACLVVEAGEKSGSLITAQFAAEQGREVFAIPGNYDSAQSRGANRLIRDGARPLFNREELLEFVTTWQGYEPAKISKQLQMSFENEDEKKVIQFAADEPRHIDEISRSTGIPLSILSSMLVMLELKGFIEEIGPQRYQKTKKLY